MGNIYGFDLRDHSVVTNSNAQGNSIVFILLAFSHVSFSTAQANFASGFSGYDFSSVTNSFANNNDYDGFVLKGQSSGSKLDAEGNSGPGIYVDSKASMLVEGKACYNNQNKVPGTDDIFVNFGHIDGDYITTDGKINGGYTGFPTVSTGC